MPDGGRMHLKSLPLLLLGLALAAGCQAPSDPPGHGLNELLQEQVEAHEAYVTHLQSVRDEGTMKIALPKLAKLGQASAARARRLSQLVKSSPAKAGDFQEWQDRLQKAMRSRLEERQRIRALPGGEAFLQQLDTLGELHQVFSE